MIDFHDKSYIPRVILLGIPINHKRARIRQALLLSLIYIYIQGIDARGEKTEETLTIAILKIET